MALDSIKNSPKVIIWHHMWGFCQQTSFWKSQQSLCCTHCWKPDILNYCLLYCRALQVQSDSRGVQEEHHSLMLKNTDQAGVSKDLGLKTCWETLMQCITYYLLLSFETIWLLSFYKPAAETWLGISRVEVGNIVFLLQKNPFLYWNLRELWVLFHVFSCFSIQNLSF